jgi:hypothetical protein
MVKDHARHGSVARIVEESVQHPLTPSALRVPGQLKDPARLGLCAASTPRAIEIPCRVESQAGIGSFPVGAVDSSASGVVMQPGTASMISGR